MRFLIGFLSPIVVEFTMVSAMIYFYCGPVYLVNVGVMLFLYTYFTRSYSKIRQQYIRQRFKETRKSEFFMNESIVNFETVKSFGNEKLEENRYGKIQDAI